MLKYFIGSSLIAIAAYYYYFNGTTSANGVDAGGDTSNPADGAGWVGVRNGTSLGRTPANWRRDTGNNRGQFNRIQSVVPSRNTTLGEDFTTGLGLPQSGVGLVRDTPPVGRRPSYPFRRR